LTRTFKCQATAGTPRGITLDTNARKILLTLALILIIALAGALAFVALPKSAQKTLIVPDNYAQINWAIGNATAGDTIQVKSGTYNNQQILIDKPVSLIGEDSSNTILVGGAEGASGGGSTITITAVNVTVSGFTLKSYSFPNPEDYFGGIALDASNCTLTGNIIENCAVGILNDGAVANISYSTISGNTIQNNLNTGIALKGQSFQVTLTNNIITENTFGITLANGYECIISENTITQNDAGAIGLCGTKTDITKNVLASNVENGIIFFGSSDLCRILNNTIEGSKIGLDLSTGARYSVGGNNISNCATYAVGFYQTSTSYVFDNNITDNAVGVWFSQSADAAPMNGTSFYRNNFLNNTQQVFVGNSGSINDWDSAGTGNYWSDYATNYPNATEVDNTGIWNTPYQIDANNLDEYPLMTLYMVP
jgi:nitrous oxidase accessory protein